MRVYFEDFKDEVQDLIVKETMEKMKTEYPEYKADAKKATMTENDLLYEMAEYHINTHNFPIKVEY